MDAIQNLAAEQMQLFQRQFFHQLQQTMASTMSPVMSPASAASVLSTETSLFALQNGTVTAPVLNTAGSDSPTRTSTGQQLLSTETAGASSAPVVTSAPAVTSALAITSAAAVAPPAAKPRAKRGERQRDFTKSVSVLKPFKISEFVGDVFEELGSLTTHSLKMNHRLVEHARREEINPIADRSKCAHCKQCVSCAASQMRLLDGYRQKKKDLKQLQKKQYPVFKQKINQLAADACLKRMDGFWSLEGSTKTSNRMPNGMYQTIAGVLCAIFPQLEATGNCHHKNLATKIGNAQRSSKKRITRLSDDSHTAAEADGFEEDQSAPRNLLDDEDDTGEQDDGEQDAGEQDDSDGQESETTEISEEELSINYN